MLKRMERKSMAKYDDFRIIFKSDIIVNSPIAYLTTLPEDVKTKIREACFALAPRIGSLQDPDRRRSPGLGSDLAQGLRSDR